MPVMSFADYARHRGCSRASVTYAVKDGRIPTAEGPDGKPMIDSDIADIAWKQNTGRTPPNAAPLNDAAQVITAPAEDITEGSAEESFAKSRARNEFFKAQRAELEYRKELGELAEVDEVAKKWAQVASRVRTKVLGIPSKTRQRVPDMTNECYITLEDLVREALEDLANGAG